jgi:2-polyprenyl-6-hydroxyphenyl methylase/3-demethylubiquinone-9 3-methyltransferase
MADTWKWKLAQTLEYQWWQRYLDKKEPKAYLQWKCAYWQNLLLQISRYSEMPEGRAILDAGCGPAGIFIVLKGNHVTAIDPLLDEYRKLDVFMPEKFPWTQFQAQRIEALSDTDKYDIVFCMNAINHVNDIGLCYDNLVRSLKPGGILVVSIDAHKYGVLRSVFRAIPGDMLHPHQYSLKEYEDFLTQRNCTISKSILLKSEKIFDYYVTIAQKN